MKLKEYLKFARSTAVYPKILVLKNPTFDQVRKCQNAGVELENITWVYPLIGLVGEVGELSNKLKKVIRDNGFVITPEIKKILLDEKGDISWYDIILDDDLGIDPDKKLEFNKTKLTQRKKTNTVHHTKLRDVYESELKKVKHSKLSLFMEIFKQLEHNVKKGISNQPVKRSILLKKLVQSGKFTLEESSNYIKKLQRSAVIYESRVGMYNTV